MKYVKKPLTEKAMDDMRISLSVWVRKLSSEPVCDFCGDPNPVYTYAATRMSTGVQQPCWRWCACVRCSWCIDHEVWHELKFRTIKRLRKTLAYDVPTFVLMSAVDQALQTFFNDAQEECSENRGSS